MDIIKALQKLHPTIQASCGETYDSIIIHDNTPLPTEAELESAWQLILAEQQATEYQRLRAPKYPPLTELADAIAKDDPVALAEYRAKCMAVKALYPKPQP